MDFSLVLGLAALGLAATGYVFNASFRGFINSLLAPERERGERSQQRRPPHLPTRQGELVRSRAEQVIADYLFERGIRYEYERPVAVRTLGGRGSARKPDFFLPDYGRAGLIWEHLGMWDVEEYRRKNRQKIARYHEMGYDFILTFGEAPSRTTMFDKLAPFRRP